MSDNEEHERRLVCESPVEAIARIKLEWARARGGDELVAAEAAYEAVCASRRVSDEREQLWMRVLAVEFKNNDLRKELELLERYSEDSEQDHDSAGTPLAESRATSAKRVRLTEAEKRERKRISNAKRRKVGTE